MLKMFLIVLTINAFVPVTHGADLYLYIQGIDWGHSCSSFKEPGKGCIIVIICFADRFYAVVACIIVITSVLRKHFHLWKSRMDRPT